MEIICSIVLGHLFATKFTFWVSSSSSSTASLQIWQEVLSLTVIAAFEEDNILMANNSPSEN
jgi:hypothetical protein